MSSKNNPGGTEEVCTMLPTDILNGLDAMITMQPETASRDEAVRRILRDWLQANGFMRDPGAAVGIKPQDLSSANDG